MEAKICAELDAIGLLATPERVSPRPMELNDLNKLPYFVNVCKVSSCGACYRFCSVYQIQAILCSHSADRIALAGSWDSIEEYLVGVDSWERAIARAEHRS